LFGGTLNGGAIAAGTRARARSSAAPSASRERDEVLARLDELLAKLDAHPERAKEPEAVRESAEEVREEVAAQAPKKGRLLTAVERITSAVGSTAGLVTAAKALKVAVLALV
jgi:hypothetical protein